MGTSSLELNPSPARKRAPDFLVGAVASAVIGSIVVAVVNLLPPAIPTWIAAVLVGGALALPIVIRRLGHALAAGRRWYDQPRVTNELLREILDELNAYASGVGADGQTSETRADRRSSNPTPGVRVPRKRREPVSR